MPDISKITLPSGTTYDIKDSVARQMISAGVSFIVAWDGASAPVAGNLPAGVEVTYNDTITTGTLTAVAGTAGAFYLVKSKTTPASETFDSYDEYVVIKPDAEDNTTWYWEKIGDTKLDLSDVVTEVALDKKTDTVIGTSATFTITQPTITLATQAASGTGTVEVVSGIDSASASGDNVTALTGLGTPSTTKVLGSSATLTNTQPTITPIIDPTHASGSLEIMTGINVASRYIKGTASGANTAWNSTDAVTAVTGYANPLTDTFVKSVTPTSKKLATTSVTGVSGSTTASKATAATAATAATGEGTTSTNNGDWLKNVSVSNETLVIGAATLDTTSIPQYTFSNVTVPQAAAATTVATGAVVDSDTNGAEIVTDVSTGASANAITDLGTPTTSQAIGIASTFTITQPTITLGDAEPRESSTALVMPAQFTPQTQYYKFTASGGGASISSKDEQTVVTGYSNTTTDTVLGTGSTITVTPATTNIKATATGANTAWNSKDSTTVLTNATGITVTKGQE